MSCPQPYLSPRETREGWPLLTVETAVYKDSKRTNENAWLIRWACRTGTRDFCSALTALVGPKKFFLTVHF
jgi:hypothetical protein